MAQRKRKNIILGIVAVLIIAALAALPFLIEKAEQSGDEASVVSAKAEIRSIDKTLSGTGTLTAEDAEDVELPSGVEITQYLVSNGDIVTEGQALAYVDRTTVLQAMASVKETLEYLEEEMTSVADNAASTYITAPAKGTVIAVYAQPGDDVQQVMLEYGALAVLEIEGKEWKAQAYTGTVGSVYAVEGKTVYANTGLFYLKDTTDSSAYDTYAAQHREYEEMMQDLVTLYEDGVLVAPCDGAVADINEVAAEELENNTSKFVIGEPIAYKTYPDSHRGTVESVSDDYSTVTVNIDDGIGTQTVVNRSKTQVTVGDTYNVIMEVPYWDPPEEEPQGDPPETEYYLGSKIEFIRQEKSLKGTIKNISNIAQGKVDVEIDNTVVYDVSTGTVDRAKISVNDSYEITYVYYTDYNGNVISSTGYEPSYTLKDSSSGANNSTMPSTASGMSGMTNMGGGASYSSSSSTDDEDDFEMYSLDSSVPMTVTPQNEITISITVDELDILSVKLGQEARMTIDALPGKSYTGTVTEINRSATNSGGNTKYSAVITLPRDDTMLAGMNASSTIIISTTEDVLTLPAEAFCEEGQKTLVYTSYDESTGTLGNPVEVTTGVSDGSYVQVLSGITEGESVYYEYTDSIDVESIFGGGGGSGVGGLFSSLTGGGGGGGGGMPGGGGGMPGGGNRG